MSCGKLYDQCGGINWTGAKCCNAGSTCQFQNDYYWQCLAPAKPTTTKTQGPILFTPPITAFTKPKPSATVPSWPFPTSVKPPATTISPWTFPTSMSVPPTTTTIVYTTPWGPPTEFAALTQMESTNSTVSLLPIVIGAAIGLVATVALAVFAVKFKRSNNAQVELQEQEDRVKREHDILQQVE